MGAHSSKEKLPRSCSERYIHSQVIERERFGSFGKRSKGAAKKRDVRNLSISPTDLGPPPKAQQTVNGTSTRPKPAAIALAQKRFTSNVQSACTTPSTTSTSASSPTGANISSLKASPLAKKFGITTRRLEVKTGSAATAKTPLKDHNRILGQATVAPSIARNASKSDAPLAAAELQEIVNGHHHLNNNNNAAVDKVTTATRSSPRTASPTLGGHSARKLPPATTTAAALPEKKTQSKLQLTAVAPPPPPSRKPLLPKGLSQQESSEETPPTPTSALQRLGAAQLQQLKLLSRHSYDGCLDYQSVELQLQNAELQQKGTVALGVLLQYLVFDLDAFACPGAKVAGAKAKESAKQMMQLLEEARSTCSELQDQLCHKEAYYTRRENELQTLHRCELEKVHASLSEFQGLAKQQIAELESKLYAKDTEHQQAMDCYRLEMEKKFAQKQQQMAAGEERERSLLHRLSAVEQSEQEMRERLASSESCYAGRLQAADEREQQLNERIAALTRELEKLRATKESNERELRDKLNLSHDEIAVLRTSRRSFNESFERGTPTRVSAPSSTAASLEITRLQSEAESLRCVLELKQKEISKLTKQNEELLRDADERVALQGKISLLESRNEMLQSELEIKSDKEKEFLRQIDDIQKAFNHETVKRTRLSYDNEALQWQLKQRSEQLHIVEAKLQELSAHESTINSSINQSSLLGRSLNGSAALSSTHVEDVSPPTSPVVKGVIEKTDSVSWVLEMDDETPEAAASKMVKRAGSFRSVERSPTTRRQLVSTSASVASTASAASALQSRDLNVVGPNPLSQSMSATSVIRQHSNEASHEFANRSHARTRSKSVSVKGTEPGTTATTAVATAAATATTMSTSSSSKSNKKLARQLSGGSVRKHELVPCAMGVHSPYNLRTRPSLRVAGAEAEAGEGHDDEALFRRSGASKLITCDTSALNSGERLEMRSLPTHSSVHDLKGLKKCQEIQESAGEAMVSGTNSEDESCSASSDDVASSVGSTSSANSDSTTSSNQMKSSRMSFEEVLLLEKINSLTGTPMEVSWSEEGETFANSSTL